MWKFHVKYIKNLTEISVTFLDNLEEHSEKILQNVWICLLKF